MNAPSQIPTPSHTDTPSPRVLAASWWGHAFFCTDLFLDRWHGWHGYRPQNQTCSGRETSTYLLLLSQILSFRKGTAKEQNGSVIDPRFLESQPVRVEIRWDRLVIRLRFDRTKRGVESRTRSGPSKVAVPRLGGTARYCHPSPRVSTASL